MRAALVVALLLLLPLPAAAEDDALVVCKVITDRAAELVRTGETERARAMKPELQRCIGLQRAARDRDARRIVNDYDARGRN